MESSNEDSGDFVCKKQDVYNIIKPVMHEEVSVQISTLVAEISKTKRNFIISAKSVGDVRKLLGNVKSRFNESHRKIDTFIKKNRKWLDSSFTIQNDSTSLRKRSLTHSISEQPSTSSAAMGRPSSEFEKSSDRTKRRRTAEMRQQHTTSELTFATEMSLRSSGSHAAANILREVTMGSPTRASKYKVAYEASLAPSPVKKEVCPDEALALIITSKLSRNAYQNIRNLQNKYGIVFLPSYKKIEEAKKRCYPDDIIVTEVSAEVKLQSLLHRISQRLLQVQNDVIKSLSQETVGKITLVIKWGCDGSSGQSQYKQKFTTAGASDGSVFFTSVVPLQLVARHSNNAETIIWKNPRPSSPRYCSPLRLQFLHETTEATKAEEKYVNDQIADLQPLCTIIDGKEIEINYELFLTMVDGKVINALTDTTSSMRCHLCGTTSKEFNSIDKMIQRPINTANLRFGISSLHAWIRFFEMFLHIAYKIDNEKWQARKQSEKDNAAQRKKIIQKGFHDELGLQVDYPKQGFGSSNDGNTARRFFQNSSVSARILGVDEDLIHRCHVILQVLASGYAVDVPRFKVYCEDVARQFVELYDWYKMPTAVHKILIHGYQIIEWAPLPIGQLSEDAQESRNKDIKNYRLHHAQKTSRRKSMSDIFNRLLISSDPVITSYCDVRPKEGKSLSSDTLQLLLCPNPGNRVLKELLQHDHDGDDEVSESASETESD